MMKNRFPRALSAAALALAVAAVLSLCIGPVRLSPALALGALSDKSSVAYRIIRFIRLPRALGAVLCGGSLAVSGLLIQSVLHNPLGSPNVLSMNAGAALAVVTAGAPFPGSASASAPAAFLGAFASLLAVVTVGKKAGASKHAIILAGVAMNAFLTAATDALTVFIPDALIARAAFRIGSLSGVQMSSILPAAAMSFAALALVFALRDRIEILSLGDDAAVSLGMNVESARVLVLLLSSVLCGSAVSVAGTVGFVGLIVPHSCRMMLGGNDMRKLLPLTALFGAAVVLLCDTASRLGTHEIPVGILLSAIGGPYFFALLVRERKAGR